MSPNEGLSLGGANLAGGAFAVLAGVCAVLIEDPGFLLAAGDSEILFAQHDSPRQGESPRQGVHALIVGMPVHLLGLAPLGDTVDMLPQAV